MKVPKDTKTQSNIYANSQASIHIFNFQIPTADWSGTSPAATPAATAAVDGLAGRWSRWAILRAAADPVGRRRENGWLSFFVCRILIVD
jgi:hypothetical protein